VSFEEKFKRIRKKLKKYICLAIPLYDGRVSPIMMGWLEQLEEWEKEEEEENDE